MISIEVKMNRVLEALVNEEQLLHMSLYVAASFQNKDEKNEIKEIADNVIFSHLIIKKEGKEEVFTEESLQEEYHLILTDWILTDMVKNGIIDAQLDDDGEFKYSLPK